MTVPVLVERLGIYEEMPSPFITNYTFQTKVPLKRYLEQCNLHISDNGPPDSFMELD